MKRLLLILTLLAVPPTAPAQIQRAQRITMTEGGLIRPLNAFDRFGSAVANLGDLNGDGVTDLAVGAPGDGTRGSLRGAVWIVFLNADGTVLTRQVVGSGEGGFAGALADEDQFGSALAAPGDLDGDGVPDLLVGAPGDDEGGTDHGAVWLLFLNRDGTVKGHRKIGANGGVDAGTGARFGTSVAVPGDLDGDGTLDLAVGADGSGAGSAGGAVWVLHLRPGGVVKDARRLQAPEGTPRDRFGSALAAPGDLDGDGTPDLVAGAGGDNDGGQRRGAVYVLWLHPDGAVKRHQKLSRTRGGLDLEGTGVENNDGGGFGHAIASLGDLDGDGLPELAVGMPFQGFDFAHQCIRDCGTVYVLRLHPDGTVRAQQDVNAFRPVSLTGEERFGFSVAALGDFDGDGRPNLAVGLPGERDGPLPSSTERGSVMVLDLLPDGTVALRQALNALEGNLVPDGGEQGVGGEHMAAPGDIDGDGVDDLVASGGGGLWILLMNPDGTVRRGQEIGVGRGGFDGAIGPGDLFPSEVAGLGDLDDDGVPDLAVGAHFDSDGGVVAGAVWVLFLNRDGTVKRHQKISNREGHLFGAGEAGLQDGDLFGGGLAGLGDFDGDGVEDLAVGASGDGTGGNERGAVYLLFLNRDGTVKGFRKILNPGGEGAFRFGRSLACPGDLDGDGVTDLAVGAGGSSSALHPETPGEVWTLHLNPDGTRKAATRIGAGAGGFSGVLEDGDRFGVSVASLGDLNGDGVPDLAVGARGDSDVGKYSGAVWLVFLAPDGSAVAQLKIIPAGEGFPGALRGDEGGFGSGVAATGDLDGDGTPDLAVGATNFFQLSPGVVWVLAGLPVLAPVLEEFAILPERAEPGRDIVFRARFFDPTGLAGVTIRFRRAGDVTFFSAPMTRESEGVYTFTLPAFILQDRAVEYVVEATGSQGATRRVPEQGMGSIPLYLEQGLRGELTHGVEAAAYRLISVPLHLDAPAARDVLEDDLGAYDPARWRFFAHTGGTQWREYDRGLIPFAPGEAFWLLVRDSSRVLTTGPGTTVTTDAPFAIPLLRGWNVIGNPFTFPVPSGQLRTTSGQPVDLRRYDGVWRPADSLLFPFEGYIVFNANPGLDTLLVDPDLMAAPPAAKRGGTPSWAIRIRARHGAARDEDNLAAVRPGAAEGWDAWDRPEPPVIGDYVSVAFPHPEWGQTATHYSTDARPSDAAGGTWHFDVTTRRPGPVSLAFEGIDTVPEAYGVWLVDAVAGVRQDLRRRPHYGLGVAEGGRALDLVVAPAGTVEEATPARVRLDPGFPNPFRGVTTLRYGVPDRTRVRLAVFDLLGRRVATLVDAEREAGHHAVVWDGRGPDGTPVAAGVLVVRMQAGGVVVTRTITRLR